MSLFPCEQEGEAIPFGATVLIQHKKRRGDSLITVRQFGEVLSHFTVGLDNTPLDVTYGVLPEGGGKPVYVRPENILGMAPTDAAYILSKWHWREPEVGQLVAFVNTAAPRLRTSP